MADVTLTYKGATIAELNDSGSKTLRTAGKFCEADIGVEYAKPSGGGGDTKPIEAPLNDVVFVDYDGTIVQEYTAAEFLSLTAMPPNPSHSGLTAQGWNWTMAEIQSQLEAVPDGQVWVGQMYTTVSGATEIDIVLTAPDLSPFLAIAVNGTIEVDWGDGSSADTMTGTSASALLYQQHTYENAGSYTISISGNSVTFVGASNMASVLRISAAATRSNKYAACVKAVRLGNNASIGGYGFKGCAGMEYISIPAGKNLGSSVFDGCYSLKGLTIPAGSSVGGSLCQYCCGLLAVAIPPGITSIGGSAFRGCYGLKGVTIPSGVTTIALSGFLDCAGLRNLSLPGGIGTLKTSAFQHNYSLVKIDILGVATIENYALEGLFSLEELHLHQATPPNLSTTGALNNIQAYCVIYVPYSADHSILEAYQTATNWSSFASRMQEEPQ